MKRKAQIKIGCLALKPEVFWELRGGRCERMHVKAEAIVAAMLLERLMKLDVRVPSPPGPDLPGLPCCAACHLENLRADGLRLLGPEDCWSTHGGKMPVLGAARNPENLRGETE